MENTDITHTVRPTQDQTQNYLYLNLKNAHLMVIGSKNMEAANANASQFVTRIKNAAHGTLTIQRTKTTINIVIHALASAPKKSAVKKISHLFRVMVNGGAIGSRTAKDTKNTPVFSW